MKITARSSLKKVAAVVSDALSGAGIRAVLTGGACATIYSGGAYQSEDLDLILQSSPTQKELDRVMGGSDLSAGETPITTRIPASSWSFPGDRCRSAPTFR